MQRQRTRVRAAAAVLASILMTLAAVLVIDQLRSGGTATDSVADARVRALERRLETLEERLVELAGLEEEIRRLAAAPSRALPGSERPAPVGDDSGAPSTGKDDPVTGAEGRVAAAMAAEIREQGDEESLRTFIADVIEDDRRRRSEERKRQAVARQREIEALHQGPYGKHNFRVNSMAKKLALSDRQREYYYAMTADYDQRIQATRKEEAHDKENRQRYRDRRRQLREEFASMILRVLSREQAEVFNDLPEHERRPDGPRMLMLSTPIPESPSESADVFFYRSSRAGEADASVRITTETRAEPEPGASPPPPPQADEENR